ncbi:MAG: TrkA family potassium uptake protein [Candidatus Eremiobacteraeota bacterium]|nr:TrkA family potassium uptake protein [Candidatus Eremiobacteraeota bacterium]
MNERRFLLRRLLLAATLLIAVTAVGTAGYVMVEGWSWFDSLYMTVTTITTIGGGEPAKMDVAGKSWTIVVVAIGFGSLTYTVLALFSYVVEGHLFAEVSQRRMRRRAARMVDHFILCGYGRVGGEIARDFAAEGIAFVIVDINPDSLERAAAEGLVVVNGNAADVATPQAAGIERARGLVTAVDADADNIYVTLSARILRPDLFIVARANREDAEPKLRLAGANRVISPYTIGGRRMASLAMRPTAVEFVDTVLSANNGQLLLEDITIAAGSAWIGRALVELFPDGDEAFVLALKRDGEMRFRPAAETPLQAGDELVAAGPPKAIRALEQRL